MNNYCWMLFFCRFTILRRGRFPSLSRGFSSILATKLHTLLEFEQTQWMKQNPHTRPLNGIVRNSILKYLLIFIAIFGLLLLYRKAARVQKKFIVFFLVTTTECIYLHDFSSYWLILSHSVCIQWINWVIYGGINRSKFKRRPNS